MRRVPPSVRMKDEIDGLLRGGVADVHPMKGFVQGLARYILQVHIEAEATEFLGRGHYRRGERARGGWRNGYEGKGIQTEAGLLRLKVPQLRATAEPFQSPLMKRLGNRSAELEEMVRGMYVRGLSTMDVEGLYGDPLMVSFDGSPGLKKAIRRMWPRVFRQRCQAHKMRNILSKLPKTMQAPMKKLVRQVFWAPSYEDGIKRGRALIARFRDRYSSAMECLEKDLEECVTYLRFPDEHH